jgi:hypothetical protein
MNGEVIVSVDDNDGYEPFESAMIIYCGLALYYENVNSEIAPQALFFTHPKLLQREILAVKAGRKSCMVAALARNSVA